MEYWNDGTMGNLKKLNDVSVSPILRLISLFQVVEQYFTIPLFQFFGAE